MFSAQFTVFFCILKIQSSYTFLRLPVTKKHEYPSTIEEDVVTKETSNDVAQVKIFLIGHFLGPAYLNVPEEAIASVSGNELVNHCDELIL